MTAVESTESGPVAVEGTAHPADDGPLSAPFSDRDCVAFEYEVREVQGKNKRTPTPLADGTESVPFYVDDGTGEVLVHPDAADLELEKEEKVEVAREEQPPKQVERFLSRRRDIGEPTEPTINVAGSHVGTRYFREQLLESGEEVYVFGQATRERSDEFGETELAIQEGAAGGHSDPTTFIVADRSKEEVASGHGSGGTLAIVLDLVMIAVGSAFVFYTSMV